jgi:hypothetical protein
MSFQVIAGKTQRRPNPEKLATSFLFPRASPTSSRSSSTGFRSSKPIELSSCKARRLVLIQIKVPN